MDDEIIDCAQFLRLTGTRLGDYGIYHIGVDGVKATSSPQTVEMSPGNSAHQSELLDFIAAARLDFPTTPSALVEWTKNQGCDFLLPSWLERAVAETNPGAALAFLNEGRQRLCRELEAPILKPLSKTEQYVAEEKRANLSAELEALERIRRTMNSVNNSAPTGRSPTTAVSKSARPKRNDNLSFEIEAAAHALGELATPELIIAQLRKFAGSKGSFIVSALPDAFLWRGRDGTEETTTVRALRKRLVRRRAGSAYCSAPRAR